MAKTKGVQLNGNGDVLVTNGHLSVGEVTYQNVYLIIASNKGEWKEHPLLGAGIDSHIGEESKTMLAYTIRTELAKDGIAVWGIDVNNETIVLDAKYR